MTYDSSYSILLDIIKNNDGQRTEFSGIYDATLYLADLLGVNVNIDYDSVYSIALGILDHFGGDVTKKYDSVYSVVKAIATANNIDVTGADSAYSELLSLVDADSGWQGLKFKAIENSTIKYTPSTVSTAEYSDDNGETWKTFDNVTVTLNEGDEIYVRGNISGNQTASDFSNFQMTGKVEADGYVDSLYDKDNFTTLTGYTYVHTFRRLFRDCTALIKAPIFRNIQLIDSCYAMMFYGCTGLTTVPELPSTKAAPSCYLTMFRECSSLAGSVVIPLTVLQKSSCSSMFISTSIQEVTILATVWADYCCGGAFQNCSELKKVTTYTDNVNYTNATNIWLNNVSATGDFYNLGGATFTRDASGIPSGWTEHTTL